MSPSGQHQQPSGPPYASPYATPGGLPGLVPDVPITAVFLAIYLSFAVANMTILQLNLRRRHKFIISGALFGFCMSRIATCSLRIAWARHRDNVHLPIAAGIFVNAGVLILYIVNLIFALRLLRARRPALGWHPVIAAVLRAFYVGIAVALALVIYAIVQSSYTLRLSTLRVARDIQLSAVTFLLIFTTLPLWLLLAAYVPPRSADAETFGAGGMRAKLAINVLGACVCVVIAGFKAGIAWEAPRLVAFPAWYHSKPAFYVFDFLLEIAVLAVFTCSRVDRRFFVPDGSAGPGDYSRRGEGGSSEKGERSDAS